MVQWNNAILLAKSHKLDPWPLYEGLRPKKWQIKAKPTWHHLENKINWFEQKKKKIKKKESS